MTHDCYSLIIELSPNTCLVFFYECKIVTLIGCALMHTKSVQIILIFFSLYVTKYLKIFLVQIKDFLLILKFFILQFLLGLRQVLNKMSQISLWLYSELNTRRRNFVCSEMDLVRYQMCNRFKRLENTAFTVIGLHQLKFIRNSTNFLLNLSNPLSLLFY